VQDSEGSWRGLAEKQASDYGGAANDRFMPVGHGVCLSCSYFYSRRFPVSLIERQEARRRTDLSAGFPLTDSQGLFVTRDRRGVSDRRREHCDYRDLDDKVSRLKAALDTTPSPHALSLHDSIVISRVLNQISIGELALLLECHDCKKRLEPDQLACVGGVSECASYRERVIGLMNLGLLARRAVRGTATGVGAYQLTHLADRLVGLFADEHSVAE
jgi:hypothetical protein